MTIEKKMKYSLISDLHIDFPQLKTPYNLLEKNVIIAGDTSNGLLGTKFINKLKNKGFDVFAIDGNHEHYSNLNQQRTVATTEAAFYENINQNKVKFIHNEKLCIIGTYDLIVTGKQFFVDLS